MPRACAACLVELQRQAAQARRLRDRRPRPRDRRVSRRPSASSFSRPAPKCGHAGRLAELLRRGADTTFDEVLEAQTDATPRTRRREVGRLYAAEDAIEVDTDRLEPAAVAVELERLFLERTAGLTSDRGRR